VSYKHLRLDFMGHKVLVSAAIAPYHDFGNIGREAFLAGGELLAALALQKAPG
jgi:hypothetical protein